MTNPPHQDPSVTVTLLPSQQAVQVGAQAVPLTRTEFQIFSAMVAQPGRAFRRSELINAGIGTVVEERTVDAHVKAIRKKLGACGVWLQTVRGIGYRWEPPGDNAS